MKYIHFSYIYSFYFKFTILLFTMYGTTPGLNGTISSIWTEQCQGLPVECRSCAVDLASANADRFGGRLTADSDRHTRLFYLSKNTTYLVFFFHCSVCFAYLPILNNKSLNNNNSEPILSIKNLISVSDNRKFTVIVEITLTILLICACSVIFSFLFV